MNLLAAIREGFKGPSRQLWDLSLDNVYNSLVLTHTFHFLVYFLSVSFLVSEGETPSRRRLAWSLYG